MSDVCGTVPNRNSPFCTLLREVYREGGKVKKRTIANLTNWAPEIVAGLRGLLKGAKLASVEDSHDFEVVRSLPHGHIAVILGEIKTLQLDRLLLSRSCPENNLALAMIISRIINPQSKIATAERFGPRRPPRSWPMSWESNRSPMQNSMARCIGYWSVSRISKKPSQNVTCVMECWFSTTLPQHILKDIRARSQRLCTRATAKRERLKLYLIVNRRYGMSCRSRSIRRQHRRPEDRGKSDTENTRSFWIEQGYHGWRPRHAHGRTHSRRLASKRRL